MSLQQQIILIWGGCLLIGILVIPYFIRKSKNKANGTTEKYNNVKVQKKFKFYSTNFLTRKNFNNIVKSYVALSCMTEKQLRGKSVKVYEKTMLVCILIPLLLLITLKNPILAFIGVLLSLVYYTTTVSKDIDSVHRTLISDISILVQSISLNYAEYNNIPRSVLEGERGDYLGNYVDEIYRILTEVDSETKLNDFIARSPLKLLCELAEVCQITNDYGDVVDSVTGSKFISQLELIEKKINLEINILALQNIKFKLLDKVALAGIVLMPIVDTFLLNQMPGTAAFINSVFGMGIKALIILLTIVAYYVISTINQKSVVSTTDFSELSYKLSQENRFKRVLDTIKPREYKKNIKVEELLSESLSSNTIDIFYTTKFMYMVFMAILGIVLSITFVITARTLIYDSTETLTFIPVLVEKRMQEDIVKMDKEYMELEEKPIGEDLLNFVSSSLREETSMQVTEQAERLTKKWDLYSNIKFKWYYLVVIYLMGVIGWFVPNMQIKLRKFMVKFEAEEDVSQMLTVMVTLAGTGLSVYEILYRLLGLSTIHKSNISYACQSFVKDPELAMDILAYSSNVTEFKRMCSKLKKAIYNIPVQDAFRNIVMDNTQALSRKELNSENIVKRKANLANLLAVAPVVCVFILQVLVPLFVLGFSQILGMESSLSGM